MTTTHHHINNTLHRAFDEKFVHVLSKRGYNQSISSEVVEISKSFTSKNKNSARITNHGRWIEHEYDLLDDDSLQAFFSTNERMSKDYLMFYVPDSKSMTDEEVAKWLVEFKTAVSQETFSFNVLGTCDHMLFSFPLDSCWGVIKVAGINCIAARIECQGEINFYSDEPVNEDNEDNNENG